MMTVAVSPAVGPEVMRKSLLSLNSSVCQVNCFALHHRRLAFPQPSGEMGSLIVIETEGETERLTDWLRLGGVLCLLRELHEVGGGDRKWS